MNGFEPLKHAVQSRLWDVVDRHPPVRSATLTGSFLDADSPDAFSDIDFVLIVRQLNEPLFRSLLADFDAALTPDLAKAGLKLRINPTLGPLKFNDPATAVLHLMLYSEDAHIDHALKSPFTCYDWQRSPAARKRTMAEMFPVVGLQPRHFLGARRSAADYLNDFRARTISYRELVCFADGYREERRELPMGPRDRLEFGYHVMKFLMQNLLKLLQRRNRAQVPDELTHDYFEQFPEGAAELRPLFHELRRRKCERDFVEPMPDLGAKLELFVTLFERQFRRVFQHEASHHVAFRHAATLFNGGDGDGRIFLGRTNPNIRPLAADQLTALTHAVAELKPTAVHCSPLRRCRQSLGALNEIAPLPACRTDDRLLEIDYGGFDGRTVGEARQLFPDVFHAWAAGEDPHFPGGENTAAVRDRALGFVRDQWTGGPSLTCSHAGVLRCLIGHALGMPARDWFRLEVPHLTPLTFLHHPRYGLFVDIPADAERALFRRFACPTED